MVKKEYTLHHLGCPICAAKMEVAIREMDGVADAALVFASKKLYVDLATRDSEAALAQIQEIVQGIEAGVVVEDKTAHDHSHAAALSDKAFRNKGISLALAGALFVTALVLSHLEITPYVTTPLFFASYLLSGWTVLLNAGRNILKGLIFDENFLISIATLGAFAINYFSEGVAVMLFFQVGEYLQNLATGRSQRSITALLDVRPDAANLKTDAGITTVAPASVAVGDVILVRPGEKIPLDGVVLEGVSLVDTSALTGESVPREVLPDSEVLAGFVNHNGLLTVRTTKEFGESAAVKILDLMQRASARKAPTENFITTFAHYYTPVVTGVALLIAVLPALLFGQSLVDWVYRALVFLVISCPCALVLSIPLGFFAGIGAASRVGVLVKGSNYLEALRDVDTLVFDKTGTLTKGVFEVTQIQPQAGFSQEKLLQLAATAGVHSTHPVAAAIRKAYGQAIVAEAVSNFAESAGLGTKALIGGQTVLVGNEKFLRREQIVAPATDLAGTLAYIAVDGRYAGAIAISDQIKPEAAATMQRLKEAGVRRLVMLTGDSQAAAAQVARELNLDAFHAELLPEQKVALVEDLLGKKTGKGKLVFVGDGINDAPVLARADVGVAMGGLGSDAAIEAADVVLMTDEPQKLLGAMAISRKTKRIVWQNIVFALGVKAIVLLLGALGLATMWAAVFADVGVSLLAVLNALRIVTYTPG